jgi:hypothetical protein
MVGGYWKAFDRNVEAQNDKINFVTKLIEHWDEVLNMINIYQTDS